MMRLLIPLILGLVLGAGAGTGAYMFTGGGEDAELLAAADSLAADSAQSETPEDDPGATQAAGNTPQDSVVPGDSTDPSDPAVGVETAEPEASQVAGTDPLLPTPADPEPTQVAAPAQAANGDAATQGASGLPEPSAEGREESAKRMAKIFSTMQARDAAKVMTLMDRDEIELVLRQLDNRSAAKILSGLDPDLAADLSQALMRPGGTL